MAEEENQEAPGGPAKKKGGGAKAFGMVILGLLLGTGAGAGGLWWAMDKGLLGKPEPAAAIPGGGGGGEASQDAKGKDSSQGAEMFKLKDLVVNLSRSEQTRYLKASVQLQLAGPVAVSKAQEKEVRIRDALIILLSNQSVDEISTMQGKYQLKRQIVARLNNVLGEGTVLNAYFSEFVVQ